MKVRYLLIVVFSFCNLEFLSAQKIDVEFSIKFSVNDTCINPNFANNKETIDKISDFLLEVNNDTSVIITNITFCGAASPEGSYQTNTSLAIKRMDALEELVQSKIDLSEYQVFRDNNYIPWEYLRSCVTESSLPYKDTIIKILDEKSVLVHYDENKLTDQRYIRLQELENGEVYRQLFKDYFADMRNAYVRFTTSTVLPELPPIEPEEPLTTSIQSDLQFIPVSIPFGTPPWTRHLYIKTNFIGLAFLFANMSAEIDLAKHWSFNLPIFYSAWNYFNTSYKFRSLSIQPEVRYWFSDTHDRWFVGAHIGMSYYNFALGGEYRYQDHGGKSPTVGGGLTGGYRLPISKDNKWKLEFFAGAGVYPVHYDRFQNTQHINEGLLVDTQRGIYLGFDQMGISLTYTFSFKK